VRLIGDQSIRFELVKDWEVLPKDWTHFDVPSICTDAEDNVFDAWLRCRSNRHRVAVTSQPRCYPYDVNILYRRWPLRDAAIWRHLCSHETLSFLERTNAILGRIICKELSLVRVYELRSTPCPSGGVPHRRLPIGKRTKTSNFETRRVFGRKSK